MQSAGSETAATFRPSWEFVRLNEQPLSVNSVAIGPNGGDGLVGQNDVQIERDAFDGHMTAYETQQASPAGDRPGAPREANLRTGRTPASALIVKSAFESGAGARKDQARPPIW